MASFDSTVVSADHSSKAGGRLADLLVGPVFALQFLTLVPPLVRREARVGELGASEAFFPLVGLALGALLAGLGMLLAPFLAQSVRDVVLVAMLAVMTGALHLDGLVDTFDGLFTGHTPGERLAAMRDPRAGAYGVVAVVSVLLLKVAALGALSGPARPLALMLAPCLGRWTIVQATWFFPYARPSGVGRAFKDGLRLAHVLLAAAMALAAALWLTGPLGLVLFGGAVAFTGLAGRAMAARLGGLSGDTYGALCELVETGVLLALGMAFLSTAK